MIDVEGWSPVESPDDDVFGRYEHASTQMTICIQQGDDWPDSIAVVVTIDNESETLCRRELTSDAVQVATEYMRLIRFSCDIGGLDESSSEYPTDSS